MSSPLVLSPSFDGIPAELRQEARWVAWKAEPRRRQSKLAKVPYDPKSTDEKASSNDPATWGTYEQAVTKYRAGGFNGVGFVLGDGWAGVDIDGCLDPVRDTYSSLAQEIVAALSSYTETSPSGTGVKIFVRGRLPEHPWCKNVKLSLEMYEQGRFFTVTGRRREGAAVTVEERTDVLAQLQEKYRRADRERTDFTPGESVLSDEVLLEKARSAANGEKFRKLFDEGDIGSHNNDHSSADFALMQMLAFWSNRDPEQMEALFSESALGQREKWTDREGYRDLTIRNAIAACKDVYTPGSDPAAALALLTKIGPGKAVLPPPVPVAGFTARELQGMDVAPPRWLVENLIPLGLFILAGPPKVGKSFLLLQAAHSVASGRKLLGNPSKKAGVAYLALEDGPSRLKKRMTDLFGGADAWPSDLHLFPSWPRLGEGGLEELNTFLDAHPGVKLVIIDTWGRFRSTSRGKNLDAYQQDTMEVGTLQTWAKDREIALVLVTHLRKSNQHAETDPFDRITGSNGQFGVADAAALLSRKRGQDNGQLAIVGRDLEHDGDIPLIRKGAAWERADGMPRAHTDKQQLALDYLIDHMHGAGPKEIAEATGLTERYVKQDALPSLMEQKLVRKDGRGAYVSTWLDDL